MPSTKKLSTAAKTRKCNTTDKKIVSTNHRCLLWARDVGETLTDLKNEVKAEGGKWGEWQSNNLTFSQVRASEYMRIFAEWEFLQTLANFSTLSIDQALRHINKKTGHKPRGKKTGDKAGNEQQGPQTTAAQKLLNELPGAPATIPIRTPATPAEGPSVASAGPSVAEADLDMVEFQILVACRIRGDREQIMRDLDIGEQIQVAVMVGDLAAEVVTVDVDREGLRQEEDDDDAQDEAEEGDRAGE